MYKLEDKIKARVSPYAFFPAIIKQIDTDSKGLLYQVEFPGGYRTWRREDDIKEQ